MRHNSCNKLVYLFVLLFFAMLTSDLTWSQESQNSQPIIAPIKVELDGRVQQSFIEIEASEVKDLSLEDLRRALQTESYHEQMKSQFDGPIVSATKRFAPESLTFFIANGLIITETMWSKGFSDPMAMERHILSLKDPIAHLSFYAFMQANGIYMHKKSKGLVDLDPHAKAQKMRFFSYGGLVWGSLASSLVADVFSPFKPCLEKMFSKDYRFNKFIEEQCKSGLEASFKQWTLKKKFSQYAPQIISLVISQKLSEVADIGARKLFGQIFNSKAIKSNASKMIYKITAADVGLTLLPSGWTIKGIRWIGKLTQFTGFIAIDHLTSSYIYRTFNNLWKPMAFDFDAFSFNNRWQLADQYAWDISKAESDKIKCPVQNEKCLSFADFPNKIENFTHEMQEWRSHLNAENEQNLYGWMELTKKILNQIQLSYSFYKSYTENLFDTLNIGYRIQNKENINMNMMPMFPYRNFPLYGIAFATNSQVSIEDQYLLSPQHIEKYQLQKIGEVVYRYKNISSVFLSKKSQNILQDLLQKLSSADINTIADGLEDLNKISGFYGREVLERTLNGFDQQLTEVATKIRNELGNPQAKTLRGQGFSTAFSTNSAYLETAREANFKWSGRNYSFKNDGDFFMYQILCGPEQGVLSNNLVMTDNFQPPSLLKNSSKLSLCSSYGNYITSDNLYKIKIDGKNQIVDYITQNINYNAVGDYRNKTTKDQFDKWWTTNVKEVIQPRFRDFDNRYKQLVEKTFQRIFNPMTGLDQLNQSKYLPKTIYETLKWETNVYINLLNSMKNNTEVNLVSNYLEAAKTSQGIYKNTNEKISELQSIFLNYIDLLKEKEMTFEKYSEVKSQIDTAMEEVKSEIQIRNKVQEEALNKTFLGLVTIESEVRRFLRMKIQLSQTLELDLQEFLGDMNGQKNKVPGTGTKAFRPTGS